MFHSATESFANGQSIHVKKNTAEKETTQIKWEPLLGLSIQKQMIRVNKVTYYHYMSPISYFSQ